MLGQARSVISVCLAAALLASAGCSVIVHRPGALAIATDLTLAATVIVARPGDDCGGDPCVPPLLLLVPLGVALITGIGAMIVDDPATVRDPAPPGGDVTTEPGQASRRNTRRR